MKSVVVLFVSLLSSVAFGQINYVSSYRKVSSFATTNFWILCQQSSDSKEQEDVSLSPVILRVESNGFLYISPGDDPYDVSFGLASLFVGMYPDAIVSRAFCEGKDPLCSCAGSGGGIGAGEFDVLFEIRDETKFVFHARPERTSSSSYAAAGVFSSNKKILYAITDESRIVRSQIVLSRGQYRLLGSIQGGWMGSKCGSGTGDLRARLSIGCPCLADVDLSGGVPDTNDVSSFFYYWLGGDDLADANCSGGTPDVEDIELFFSQWLAGGC